MKQTIWFIITFLSFGLFTCSAPPDPNAPPGFCSLNCAGAVIAGNETNIRLIGASDGEEITVNCQATEAGSSYFSKIPIRFSFEKNASPLPAETIPGDKQGLPESASNTNPNRQTVVPLGGVSFEVAVIGGSMSTDAAEANPSDPNDYYRGILTPQDEWCTDTCGVGTLEIKPKCEQDQNDILLLVRSGNVGKILKVIVEP